MNNVVLILPFYGSLPWYFNFFLKSLRGKPFDVLFVSDLSPVEHPGNFRHLKMDFASLNRLVNSKLGVNVAFKNAYKLCDFKPMYGKVFEDYISGYEYWAFGDCDLVYGSMMGDLLARLCAGGWDVASLRAKWISGSFCLMRNVPSVNSLYTRVRTLPRMLDSEECVQFDELGGQWFEELAQGIMTIEDCEKVCDSFTAAVWRSGDVRFFHEDIICENALDDDGLTMKDGRLEICGAEIPVFHFINAKHAGYFSGTNVPYGKIGSYHVDETGFYMNRAAWAFRPAVSRARKIGLHLKWYRDIAGKKGAAALFRHLMSKLKGRQ